MKSSEIFDNYAKIALEQGLISEAEDKTNPRYDSQDLSAIEILYGVKPNGKDEKHIMEQAHPESVVVAPAHDKVNGLVENELERQDIMVGIARKPNTGNLGAKRYVQAKEELLNEVIKVGFLLDRNNQDDLMAFADDCADRLVKEALAPLGVAGWLIVSGIITALSVGGYAAYKGNHPDSQGFVPDLQNALEEVMDALDMDDRTWDVGDYPELQSVLGPFVNNLQKLQRSYTEFDTYRQEIIKTLLQFQSESDVQSKRKIVIDNAKALVNTAKYSQIIKVMDALQAAGQSVLEAIPGAAEQFMGARSKYDIDSGPMSGLKDLYYEVVQSDAEDAADSLNVLASSIPVMLAEVTATKQKLDQLKSISGHSETGSQIEELMQDEAPKPGAPNQTPAKPQRPQWA